MTGLAESREQLAFLAEAGMLLSASLDVAESMQKLAQLAIPRLADWAAVDLVGADGALQQVGIAHTDPEKVELARAFRRAYPPDLDSPTGVPNVLRTGQPEMYREIPDELLRAGARSDEEYAFAQRLALHSALLVPLLVRGQAVGAITLIYAESGRHYDQADVDLAQEVAARAAIALDNARLFEAQRSARHAAELAEERLALLSQASEILSRSLDLDTTLKQIARLCVAAVCDYCVTEVGAPGDPQHRIVVAHRHTAAEDLVRQLRQRWPAEQQPTYPTHAAARTRRAVVHDHIDASMLRAAARDADHLAVLQALAPTSDVIVPMISGGDVVGTISLVTTEGSTRRLGHDSVPLLEDLAHRAALAVTNAHLYQQQRSIARTLQQSLLPRTLPTIPGVDMAVSYVPGGDGMEVGGDFYDVFATCNGRFVVVVGDVCGKGVDAAALTGLARHTVRAAATASPRDLAQVLTALNGALLAWSDDFEFCTVALAALERRNGHVELEIVSAGHPVPICHRADGSVEAIGAYGSLLGVLDEPRFVASHTELHAGDTVVFYTDGVIERHGQEQVFGEERLRAIIASYAGRSAGSIVNAIEQAATAGRTNPEDMAIVVIRIAA